MEESLPGNAQVSTEVGTSQSNQNRPSVPMKVAAPIWIILPLVAPVMSKKCTHHLGTDVYAMESCHKIETLQPRDRTPGHISILSKPESLCN